MPKKTEKIEVRIDADTKQAFIEYAEQLGVSISTLIRNYIEESIQNGKKN